jgi:hypothetical protein
MANKFSIKRQGGFSLGTGTSTNPVFSDDGKRFAAIIANRASIWDLDTRERIAVFRSAGLTYPEGLALNEDGSRLAMSGNGGSPIDVFNVASGERITRIGMNITRFGIIVGGAKKVALSADGHKVFGINGGGLPGTLSIRPDGSRQFKPYTDRGPGFFIWSADTGDLLERYDLPLHGIVPDSGFLETSLSQTRSGRLLVANFMGDAKTEECGLSDFLWLWTDRGMQKIETGLNESTATVAPDGERVFLAGKRQQDKTVVFRLIDLSGAVLAEKEMDAERTFPNDQPAWHLSGKRLFWRNCDSSKHDEAWLIDAATLEVEKKILWPHIHVAFGQNGWMALAGDAGVVIPEAALDQVAARIGQPAAELKCRKMEAYRKEIEVR